jgi:acetylornithine deacetylase/succinyl-diaminopimelate desuccinylase-like protein
MPECDSRLAAVLARITTEPIKALLVELARAPSPLTGLLEAEPKLRAFIDSQVEARLRRMRITNIRRDRMGNLLARYGERQSGRSLMLVTNAMNQPAATMPNPYGGEVRDGAEFGLSGEVVLGKGLSEQKAPLAAVLLALDAIVSSGAKVAGEVVFVCCVSGETGRHDAIRTLIEETGARADMAVLNGTGNRISLGNRGRVDVAITVCGTPCHSSRPKEGCNAVTGAVEVIRRLSEQIKFTASHPALGTPTMALTRLRSFPDSTHTIPDRCEITIDRRLLPGESPEAAVADIEKIAGALDGAADPASGRPWRVEVEQGAMMYPSLVAPDSRIVRALTRASETALGTSPEMYYASNAFDQGYLNHIGIEACTYGPGEERFAHTDFDLASVDRTRDAAKVYAALIIQEFGLVMI